MKEKKDRVDDALSATRCQPAIIPGSVAPSATRQKLQGLKAMTATSRQASRHR